MILIFFGDDRMPQNLSCDIVIIRTSYDDLSLMAFLTDCPLALESAAARDGGGRCGGERPPPRVSEQMEH